MPKVFTGIPVSDNKKIRDVAHTMRNEGLGDSLKELGLTDSLLEMTLRCMHPDPCERPDMTEVVGLLRKMATSSLSMEADLLNFFEVCKDQGRDGQQEKAQEFADELDEVRYTEMRIDSSSHRKSRRSITQVFTRKNGSNI